MDSFLDSMRHSGGFGWIMFGLKVMMENYIETGQKSKVDIGPVLSTVSSNFIDGIRIRTGAQTTANLSPHLFAKGFVAHGFDSKKN